MAGKTYIGISNIARAPWEIYAGDNSNVARSVKAVYVGDPNNIARKVWPSTKIPDGSYQEVEWASCIGRLLVNSIVIPRVIIDFVVSGKNSGSYSSYYNCPVFTLHLDRSVPNGDGTYTAIAYWQLDFYINSNDGSLRQEETYVNFSTGVEEYFRTIWTSIEETQYGAHYTLDLFVNNRVMLYCDKGYYSNSNRHDITNFRHFPTDFTPIDENRYMTLADNYDGYRSGGSMTMANTYSCKYVRIYSVQVLSGNTYLRKLIPCYRKSDNIYGTYDLVDNLFINWGTIPSEAIGPIV